MIIILLRGFSHSGKDFVGNILSTQYGYKQFSFADSLKKIVAEKYNIELNLLYSQEGKKMIFNNETCKNLLCTRNAGFTIPKPTSTIVTNDKKINTPQIFC